MSKSYGMAGWRLGYMVYPKHLHPAMRSLQDTIPTHATIASQQVGLAAMDPTEGGGGKEVSLNKPCQRSAKLWPWRPLSCRMLCSRSEWVLVLVAQWVKERVASLQRCRERMWGVVSHYLPRTVRTNGAFYFCARLPDHLAEDDVVTFLARECKLLVMPGRAFGAPGHLRLSYGSLPEEPCMAAIDRLERGLKQLIGGELPKPPT